MPAAGDQLVGVTGLSCRGCVHKKEMTFQVSCCTGLGDMTRHTRGQDYPYGLGAVDEAEFRGGTAVDGEGRIDTSRW